MSQKEPPMQVYPDPDGVAQSYAPADDSTEVSIAGAPVPQEEADAGSKKLSLEGS
jgi:hypothetical protein